MKTSPLPWIKLYIEIIDNPSVGELPASTRWRFIELLAIAGSCDAEGYLLDGETPFTVSRLAWRLRTSTKALSADLALLVEAGLVVQDDETFLIPSFASHQGRTQEEKRRQWRERQQRHRQSKAGGEPGPDSGPVDGCGEPTNEELYKEGMETFPNPGGYGNPPENEPGGREGSPHELDDLETGPTPERICSPAFHSRVEAGRNANPTDVELDVQAGGYGNPPYNEPGGSPMTERNSSPAFHSRDGTGRNANPPDGEPDVEAGGYRNPPYNEQGGGKGSLAEAESGERIGGYGNPPYNEAGGGKGNPPYNEAGGRKGNPPYNEAGGGEGNLPEAEPASASAPEEVSVTGDVRDRVHAGVPRVTLPEGDSYSKGDQDIYCEESHPHDAGAGGRPQALPAQVLPARPARKPRQVPGADQQPQGGKTVDPRPGRVKEDDGGEARGLNPSGGSLKADSQVMRMTNASPIDHYCKLFNCHSLNPAQRGALLKLEATYGAAQLCKVISWAAEKDIPPSRAIAAIRSATRAWREGQDSTRSPAASPQGNSSPNRYDQYKG